MSTFAIYKSNKISLKKMGIINKVIYVLVGLIWAPLSFSSVLRTTLNISDTMIYLALIIWVIALISLILFSRYINKNLVHFGDLKIHKEGITKSISGLIDSFAYDSIKEISIKKHMKFAFFATSKDGSKTYLITIVSNNSKQERFIVSSHSIDKPDINLIDIDYSDTNDSPSQENNSGNSTSTSLKDFFLSNIPVSSKKYMHS